MLLISQLFRTVLCVRLKHKKVFKNILTFILRGLAEVYFAFIQVCWLLVIAYDTYTCVIVAFADCFQSYYSHYAFLHCRFFIKHYQHNNRQVRHIIEAQVTYVLVRPVTIDFPLSLLMRHASNSRTMNDLDILRTSVYMVRYNIKYLNKSTIKVERIFIDTNLLNISLVSKLETNWQFAHFAEPQTLESKSKKQL